MKIRITVILIAAVIWCGSSVNAEWVQCEKRDVGYIDRRGNPVNIDGRRNRFGIDEFYHVGTLYPDFGSIKIREWHEFEGIIIVDLDGTKEQISDEAAGMWSVKVPVSTVERVKVGGSRIYVSTPTKTVSFDLDFKVVPLTSEEALKLIAANSPAPNVVSGVTR